VADRRRGIISNMGGGRGRGSNERWVEK